MNTATLVLIVLLALFVGASIPVLMQFRATLREMEKRLQGLGERVETILSDSQLVARRLATLSGGLEGGEDSVRDLMDAIGRLSKSVTRASGWVGLATSFSAAVGPALLAALQAYRAASAGPDAVDDEDVEYDDQGQTRHSSRVSPPASGETWPTAQGPGRSDEPFFRGLVDQDNNNKREQQRGAGHER